MNNSSTYYHLGRRIPGEYLSVESAFINAGLSKKEASNYAIRFDPETGLALAPIPGGWLAVHKIGERFGLYDVVKTHCTNEKDIGLFCDIAKRLAATSGHEAELIVIADMPKSALH